MTAPNPFDQKFSLITGGSSGIGLACAVQLAQAGSDVTIIARTPDRLSAAIDLIAQARVRPSQKFHCISADVIQEGVITNTISQICSASGPPDFLINSAGDAYPGYVEELPISVYRGMMEVNFFGTLYTTQAVLPAMLSRGSGHIVNLSSIAGLVGIFGYAAYGASKFALRGYSDILRSEVKSRGVNVSLVISPDVDTPQLAFENQYKPKETFAFEAIFGATEPITAEKAASEILKGVARKQYLILPGFYGKLAVFLVNILGSAIYPVIDFLVAQARKKVKSSAS